MVTVATTMVVAALSLYLLSGYAAVAVVAAITIAVTTTTTSIANNK